MNMTIDASRQPVVFQRGGEVFANSRDVAAFFGKEHRNVLRDIDNLIVSEPSLGQRPPAATGGVLTFEQTPYIDPQNGRTYRSYNMNRDGFTLLAMGFNGAKALQFKLKYIEAFNAMEAELRRSSEDLNAALNDPARLRGLLSDYSERVIELQDTVEEMTPKVHALARIAEANGSLCITDAAKTLQVPRGVLFAWLREHRWIYSRPGMTHDVGYQDKIRLGYLEHKVTTVSVHVDRDKAYTQVRVTPKGLTRLAQEFLPLFGTAH